MIFLTPGEKIKKIRKQLGMTQLELEDVNLKRNFISMIENGDRCASKRSAKTLAQKLNDRARKLGVDLLIDENYLLATPKSQAEDYCNTKLIEVTCLEDFDEIITIAKEYALEEIELEIYIQKGNMNISKAIYSEAFLNFLRAMDVCKNIRNLSKQAMIFNKLGACKLEEADYLEALEYFSKAFHYSTLYNDNKIKIYSLFNISLVYSNLGKYEKAIQYSDELLSFCDKEKDSHDYINAYITKAISLREMGRIDEAIEMLNNLVSLSQDNKNLLVYIYNNLGATYLKTKDYEKALLYYNYAEGIVGWDDKYLMHGNKIDKAQVYTDMGKCSEAISLVEEGIGQAEEYNDIEYLLKSYYMMIELYRNDKCNKRVKGLCHRLLTTIETKKLNMDKQDIYCRLSLIYLNENDIEKSKEYLRLSLNLKK